MSHQKGFKWQRGGWTAFLGWPIIDNSLSLMVVLGKLMFKTILLSIGLLLAQIEQNVHSQTATQKSANEYEERTMFYEAQASALTSFAILESLQLQDRLQSLKPFDISKLFEMDENFYKSVGYTKVLQKRKDDKDPLGAFFYGAYKWDFCARTERASIAQPQDVKKCWLEVFDSFKIASDAKVADASMNIAKLYERGRGVTISKFAAADWYVKAADQYNAQKERDDALAAVEAALNAVPDHPAALRRKKAMLK